LLTFQGRQAITMYVKGCTEIYHTMGESGVISSYHIYASLLFRHDVGQALIKCLLLWHHFLTKIVIIRTFA